MIKIWIIDDHQLFRDGLCQIISDIEGVRVISTFDHPSEISSALKKVKKHPDIIIVDIQLPDINGIQLIRNLREKFPNLKFIIMSGHISHFFIQNALSVGARAYLCKNTSVQILEECIKDVHHKNYFINQYFSQKMLFPSMQKQEIKDTLNFKIKLTRREKEIATLIAGESSHREIADKLYISPRTVEVHKDNILKKINAKKSVGIAIYAAQLGWI